MDGYLLDTTILSAYLVPTHRHHIEVLAAVEDLTAKEYRYISVVALAELTTGAEFIEAFDGRFVPAFRERLIRARKHPLLDISHHTASAYAKLKRAVAEKFMPEAMKKKASRKRFVEDWIDETTGKELGIDENDLWMCAQAKERDLILVTDDKKMVRRIGTADPDLRLELLGV